MNKSRLLDVVYAYVFVITTSFVLQVGIVSAQTFQFDVNPKGSFTNSGGAPTIIDLAKIGIHPGMVVTLERVGAYSFFSNPCSDPIGYHQRSVFSSTNELLPASVANRVPGAIDTRYGDTNAPYSLYYACCSGVDERNGVTVRVPDNAAFLFVMSGDSLYTDNQVHCTEGVYAIRITVVENPLIADFDIIRNNTFNPKVTPEVTPKDNNVQIGRILTVDASRSVGNIVKYEWDFGDHWGDVAESWVTTLDSKPLNATPDGIMDVYYRSHDPEHHLTPVTLTVHDALGRSHSSSLDINIVSLCPLADNLKGKENWTIYRFGPPHSVQSQFEHKCIINPADSAHYFTAYKTAEKIYTAMCKFDYGYNQFWANQGVMGWRNIDRESDDDKDGFLDVIEFIFDNGVLTVTQYEIEDLYKTGPLPNPYGPLTKEELQLTHISSQTITIGAAELTNFNNLLLRVNELIDTVNNGHGVISNSEICQTTGCLNGCSVSYMGTSGASSTGGEVDNKSGSGSVGLYMLLQWMVLVVMRTYLKVRRMKNENYSA